MSASLLLVLTLLSPHFPSESVVNVEDAKVLSGQVTESQLHVLTSAETTQLPSEPAHLPLCPIMPLSDLAVHFLVSWAFKKQSHTHMAIKVVCHSVTHKKQSSQRSSSWTFCLQME